MSAGAWRGIGQAERGGARMEGGFSAPGRAGAASMGGAGRRDEIAAGMGKAGSDGGKARAGGAALQ